MASQTLKEKVLQSVNKLEDDSILQGLLNYIELESDNDSIYEFDDVQLQSIEEAKQQVKEGLTQSHSDVNKEIEEWLNK
ncbi:hypothetical protein [Portibacter lacus]|uniref:Uncharacterized protein n=1 Tax=Portibacter lacus TaxID=1099794 RepID=A0AA37SL66_9BACT|nr:hypothetical protein [Portibacter lacus]GLR15992.1 hypothetical protein GCM10007940_06070 [Portibacter lacus]